MKWQKWRFQAERKIQDFCKNILSLYYLSDNMFVLLGGASEAHDGDAGDASDSESYSFEESDMSDVVAWLLFLELQIQSHFYCKFDVATASLFFS